MVLNVVFTVDAFLEAGRLLGYKELDQNTGRNQEGFSK
jgi:hypothetical protein